MSIMRTPESTLDINFIASGIKILNKTCELLIMIVYPYSAGNTDFILVRNENELVELLKQRLPKEKVFLFKSFEIIKRGQVDEYFINDLLANIVKPLSGDWLVIWDIEPRKPLSLDSRGHWHFFDNKAELEEELRDGIGRGITILVEPNWIDEEFFIAGYTPDLDGIVRPGAY